MYTNEKKKKKHFTQPSSRNACLAKRYSYDCIDFPSETKAQAAQYCSTEVLWMTFEVRMGNTDTFQLIMTVFYRTGFLINNRDFYRVFQINDYNYSNVGSHLKYM